jgi:hypothetical protein
MTRPHSFFARSPAGSDGLARDPRPGA